MPNVANATSGTLVQTGYVVEQFTTNNPRFRYSVRVYLDGVVLTEGKFATQGLANVAYTSWIEEIKSTGRLELT